MIREEFFRNRQINSISDMNLRDLCLYPTISRKLGILLQRVVKRSVTQTVPVRNERLLQQCYS